MQLFIIAAIVGFAAAAFPSYPDSIRPQAGLERNAKVLENNFEADERSYRYSYKTENGINAEQQGTEVEGIEAQGSFQYPGDDGQIYAMVYVAGKDGFVPQGAHIPTPPPIPKEILEALEKNARDEAAGIFDDGKYYAGKYDAGVAKQQVFRPQINAYRPTYKN